MSGGRWYMPLLPEHEWRRRARERLDAAVFAVCVASVVLVLASWISDAVGWPW